MAQYIFWIVAGIAFGVANVIPGVSGGTIAVIFGVYERIIGFASHIRSRFRQDWKFVLFLGIGMGIGILGFAKFMDWVLSNYPALANSFFVGVMLGSLPMLAKKAFQVTLKNSDKTAWRFSPSSCVCMLVTLGVMIFMFVFQPEETAAMARDYVWTDAVKMFLIGVVAAVCMIIPGISGSFVLVMLGSYEEIVSLVSRCLDHALAFDIAGLLTCWPIIPFAFGVLAGVIYCSKLIQFLMDRFSSQTYGAILGFVLGSILMIFPGFAALNWLAVLLMLVGIAAILLFEHFSPAD